MSFRRSSSSSRSGSVSRQQQPRPLTNHNNVNALPPNEVIPDILPELVKIVRKLLPKELPMNMHVRDVEYAERGCERLRGTLYMTTFRLVFAPDNELSHDNVIISGNKYLGEFDIPLTSIFKIIEAPVDTQPGFTSYLNKHQIGSETRTFSILTRDFRYISFTKSSDTRSNTVGMKHQMSTTKMESYIEALKIHTRFQRKELLYPYRALESHRADDLSQRSHRSHSFSVMTIGRATDDDIADFSLSDDDRIRSYMTGSDWQEELNEADEQQWIVNRYKFNRDSIAQEEGPYVQLANVYDDAAASDLIWHWTHTSGVSYNYRDRRQVRNDRFILLTVPGIGEISTAGEPLRRAATDTALVSSMHYLYEQPFHRYNLAKFPCNLKRLQTSYEKLIELCVTDNDQDDEKWWTKLSACKWLKYISKTLHGAASLAKLLNFKNIELAGSDTDFSCLFSSLIQIFLRRKCRTIKGFCELIVREWIVRGHRFRERFGQVVQDSQGYPAQEAPVFLLFLDCVHQLIVQNPFAFEFTDHLLIELYRSVCYCYHQTFVFNDIYERLDAITRFPKNLLLMSTFDFSLYLYSDIYRLLKNEASVFCQTAAANLARNKTRRFAGETTASPPVTPRNRPTYQIEPPKSNNFVLDIPISNDATPSNPEQYEYGRIECPQTFTSDLHVDWRAANLELWSQCYCRYDHHYLPSLAEQRLVMEINCLRDDFNKTKNRSKRNLNLDTFHFYGHANSWHPQALDTRV